jgi:hypothetical protein
VTNFELIIIGDDSHWRPFKPSLDGEEDTIRRLRKKSKPTTLSTHRRANAAAKEAVAAAAEKEVL